ncbi:MAG: metallophosphoesterase [Oscillospiraceae bacterium]|nr:metallophosphoesterase [Oscillospiraceae bacterium]
MSLFVIADLHLSLTSGHPMDIFPGWENYVTRIKDNWLEFVKPDDTVVIPGDVSWGMGLAAAKEDFAFINALPGTKIISKGNHDYWWNTVSKMERFFTENGFDTLHILHNNTYAYEGFGICGTRGWVNDDSDPGDALVIAREVQRLEVSIKAALDRGLEPLVFLHYPPFFGQERADDIVEVLHKYNIRRCFYGHVHGKAHRKAVTGMTEGIDLRMISADFLNFVPYKIM